MSNIIRDEIKRLLKETIKGSIEDVLKNLKEKPHVIPTEGPCKGGQNIPTEEDLANRPPPHKGQGEQMCYGDLENVKEGSTLVPTTVLLRLKMPFGWPIVDNTKKQLLILEKEIYNITLITDYEVIDVIQQ